MKISVILNTYRSGGLDVAFSGLANQQFDKNDWEVILVDTLYDMRKTAVKKYLKEKEYDIPLLHVKPKRTTFPELDSGSMHRNSGIALAEGELVIFLCDFSYTYPEWLSRHWHTYQESKPATCMAPHRYRAHPEIKPTWAKEPISLFKKEFTPDMLPSLEPTGPGTQDPKLTLAGGGISGSFFHLKNESVKLESLLLMNGCDEGYDVDGGHCYSDMDLGFRSETAGNNFVLDPSNIIEIVQVRDFYPFVHRNRTTDQDYQYYLSRVGQWEGGNYSSSNDYNIRDFREKMLKLKWKKRKQH